MANARGDQIEREAIQQAFDLCSTAQGLCLLRINTEVQTRCPQLATQQVSEFRLHDLGLGVYNLELCLGY